MRVPIEILLERGKEDEDGGDAFMVEMKDESGRMNHSLTVVPGLRLGMNVGPGAGALFEDDDSDEEEEDLRTVDGSTIAYFESGSGPEPGTATPVIAPSVVAEEKNDDEKESDEKPEVTEETEKAGREMRMNLTLILTLNPNSTTLNLMICLQK